MEELERQKEKYNALEKTWMAANQQFMEFQVSPDRPGILTLFLTLIRVFWDHHRACFLKKKSRVIAGDVTVGT